MNSRIYDLGRAVGREVNLYNRQSELVLAALLPQCFYMIEQWGDSATEFLEGVNSVAREPMTIDDIATYKTVLDCHLPVRG
jgi:hypothetical protein